MTGGIALPDGRHICAQWAIDCAAFGHGKNDRTADAACIAVAPAALRLLRCAVAIIRQAENRKCAIGKLVGRKIEIPFRRRGENRNLWASPTDTSATAHNMRRTNAQCCSRPLFTMMLSSIPAPFYLAVLRIIPQTNRCADAKIGWQTMKNNDSAREISRLPPRSAATGRYILKFPRGFRRDHENRWSGLAPSHLCAPQARLQSQYFQFPNAR